jgi:hypothetical protein
MLFCLFLPFKNRDLFPSKQEASNKVRNEANDTKPTSSKSFYFLVFKSKKKIFEKEVVEENKNYWKKNQQLLVPEGSSFGAS